MIPHQKGVFASRSYAPTSHLPARLPNRCPSVTSDHRPRGSTGVDPGIAAPEEHWTLVSMMRYRSRRDMIALVATESFAAAHVFKHAEMPATCSFPMERVRFVAGPVSWSDSGLAMLAALAYWNAPMLHRPAGRGVHDATFERSQS